MKGHPSNCLDPFHLHAIVFQRITFKLECSQPGVVENHQTNPCLVVFADLLGILGGLLVAMVTMGQSAAVYGADSIAALELRDIFTGLIKAVAFAAIIGVIGCRMGMAVSGGADEVGRATTSAVVRSIVLVIVSDLLVTAVIYVRG